MNIYALKGHQVVCTTTTEAGTEEDKVVAITYLELDKIYIIEATTVYKYRTVVVLKEFPHVEFNSVFFEDVIPQKVVLNKRHHNFYQYNPFENSTLE